MELEMMVSICKMAAVLAFCLSALGSAFGTGIAGMAAIGAWKRCYVNEKPAPFILITFVGAPLSQTIYGMILMTSIINVCNEALANPGSFVYWPNILLAGILGGLAIAASSWLQGKAGAAAVDALGETGQGFGSYLMTIGVVETIALFVLVFIEGTF